MNKTNIPWADRTWNPITGCTKGCEYCYARAIAKRFEDSGNADTCAVRIHDHWQAAERDVFPAGFAPTIYQHRLYEPFKLRKPARIFLGSMGDLFDPAFPDEFRDRIFATVAATRQHTYMLLTKQPENMRRYFAISERRHGVPVFGQIPLRNLWLGVTVTNQADADERIPLLLDTPAAHRFVSVEPMLGPVDLAGPLKATKMHAFGEVTNLWPPHTLDAVIVGGKTPGKPLHEQSEYKTCSYDHAETVVCHPTCAACPQSWLRSLRDQCLSAGVPFHYKHGKHNPALDGVVHEWRPEEARHA